MEATEKQKLPCMYEFDFSSGILTVINLMLLRVVKERKQEQKKISRGLKTLIPS